MDVSGLPASVKTLLFASESDLTAVKAETTNFEWGGSQTTYYDANGLVLGYSDTYSDDWDGDEVIRLLRHVLHGWRLEPHWWLI